jgi:sugar lactone lactonase YvrE
VTAGGSLGPLSLGPDELGEGIGWHAARRELWRVDVLARRVHRTRRPLADLPAQTTDGFSGEVGFALPRRGGGMVVGVERQLWLVDDAGTRTLMLELDEPRANRWNDATCDPGGRLWAGTFARDGAAGAANLYRVDPDGAIERVLSSLTVSNGLGWLDGGERLHFVDSPAQQVEVFDVDTVAGTLSGRRVLAEIRAEDGAPDGLAVDVEGGTWVALFGGAAIRRYSCAGELEVEIRLPVPHVTNVCLGGDRGDELFATTTKHRLSGDERAALPDAGRVFHGSAPVAGTPLLTFAG